LPTPHNPARRPLQNAIDTDVCIIGGGLTGIATAYELAACGVSVVVLEAAQVGAGETGASGGHLMAGFAADIRETEAAYDLATVQMLWDLSVAALDRAKTLAGAVDCPRNVASGHLITAETEAQAAKLRDIGEYLDNNLGYPTALVSGTTALQSHIRSPAYIEGLFDGAGAHLDPLAFVSKLALAAESAGAQIYEQSPVLSVDHIEGRVVVPAGTVTARHVVVATGPWLSELIPDLKPYLSSIYSYAARFGPPTGTLPNLLPFGVAVSDSWNIPSYVRPLQNGDLHFGFPCSVWPAWGWRARQKITARLRAILPQTVDWDCRATWRGSLSVSMERLPVCGRNERLLWAGNYSGQGLVWSVAMGGLIRDVILGNAASFDRIAALPRSKIPYAWSAPLPTAAKLACYKMQDWRHGLRG
jgi:gamma-glutamylputrescine oxidase